jgi:WD40 repeat protein
MMLTRSPDFSSTQPDSSRDAKTAPLWPSRRKRLLRVAGLPILLVSLCGGDWSQSSKFRILGQHPRGVITLAFAPDGKTLYSGCQNAKNAGGAGKVWDVASGRERGKFPGGSGMALSPGGRLVATTDGDSQTIDVWDTGTGRKRATLHATPKGLRRQMLFSPDGKMLVVTGVWADGQRENIGLWDLASGKKVREFGS